MIRVSKSDQIASLREMCNQKDERIVALEQRVADLQQFHDWALPIATNEWICKGCGIRQENPEKPEATF